jgi:DNA polymerase I
MPAPRLFLIDGSNQMYRAYHAIRGLTNPHDGKSTNAVYGFVTMLRKLIDDNHPEYMAASFDLAGPTFRRELATDYKANRSPMPPDLVEQIAYVHEACRAMGVPILTYERYEADDVIGTLAQKASDAGFEVALVTGDKDFYQLVDGKNIKVYNPKDDGTWYDPEGVLSKFGVRPDQVVDVLALMGDSIDNVKGVPGIGEKGAIALIQEFGTLDALLAAAPALTPKLKRYGAKLVEHAESARSSRELLRIHTDVPVEFDPEAARYPGPDNARCFDLFSKLGFRSLVMEFAPTAETVANDYAALRSASDLQTFVNELRQAGSFAFHLVTDTDLAMRAEIVGIALAHQARQARYVPLAQAKTAPVVAAAAGAGAGGKTTQRAMFDGSLLDEIGEHTVTDTTEAEIIETAYDLRLDLSHALQVLKPLLEDPKVRKISHDVKFAEIVLERHGIELKGGFTDTILLSYVLDATRSSHRLEDLALEELTYRMGDEETLRGKGVKALAFAQVPTEAMTKYASERVDLTLQLAPRLLAAMQKTAGLEKVYQELEVPLVPVLRAMEMAGVRVDAAVLAQQATKLDAELNERAARIYAMVGETFNINSPKQLGDVLFEKLKLPALKRTGKNRTASTAQEVLEELAFLHEAPREILEWRGLQKLKGTYVDALPQLIHPKTGRVHTTFSQATAATGRLSSSDPNLQNVPIRTEVGREIRRAFIAEPGHLLISADYSQIELRVLAHLSEDESLMQAFQRHEDIHDRTALKVFGTDSGLSKHELRRRAKIINYALLYGKTAFTLSKDIGVPVEAAQEFIDAYFNGFPGVRTYLDAVLAKARETNSVETMFGRRRLVPDINNRNPQVRWAAERITSNMPIQGSAADILKVAMINLHAALGIVDDTSKSGARMILTVHDELLFEVKKEAADEVAAIVRQHMESAVPLKVPLVVDVGMGENWKEAKE